MTRWRGYDAAPRNDGRRPVV